MKCLYLQPLGGGWEVGFWGSGTPMASNNLQEGALGGHSPVSHLWDDVMPILVI